jgi:hypothetical protein
MWGGVTVTLDARGRHETVHSNGINLTITSFLFGQFVGAPETD